MRIRRLFLRERDVAAHGATARVACAGGWLSKSDAAPRSADRRHGKQPVTYLILMADGLHNFIGGLAIGASFLVSMEVGVITWIAAAAHEIPQELGDFGILIRGGWGRMAALAANFVSAATIVPGALLAYHFSADVDVTFLLAFAAGNFLYIAASDLIPEVKHDHLLRKNILHFGAFVSGNCRHPRHEGRVPRLSFAVRIDPVSQGDAAPFQTLLHGVRDSPLARRCPLARSPDPKVSPTARGWARALLDRFRSGTWSERVRRRLEGLIGGWAMKRSDGAVIAAAGISLVTSIFLWFGGQRDEGLFVGLWVPSIMAFAAYVRLTAARQ